MTVATAATWIFAVLLAVAGTGKIVAPAATSAALQGARLPADRRLVRLLGAGEILLAGLVLLAGGVLPAIAMAVAYAVFAAFAWRQSRRGAGCGCFGDAEAPATNLHVVVDAAGAVAAAVAAFGSAPGVPSALRDANLVDITIVLALLVLGGVVVRLTLTALPELAVAARLDADGDAA